MKKKLYYAGLIILLAGFIVIPVCIGATPKAKAIEEAQNVSHNHSPANQADRHDEDLEALFDRDEDVKHDDRDEHADHDEHDHTRKPSERAADAHAGHDHGALDGICEEHNVGEAECALCQGSHLSDLLPSQGMKVRLASLDVATKAGIQVTNPQQVLLSPGVEIPGQVKFNRRKLAYITPLATGIIHQVNVQPGAEVNKGDALAEVVMPDVAGLKAEYRSALARQAQADATYLREKNLLERGISSQQEFQQAASDYQASQSTAEQYRQVLLNFGLSEEDIAQVAKGQQVGGMVMLRAPFDGVVTDVQTAIGEAVSAGNSLFTVADLDSLWIELAVPESLICQAETGTTIQALFDGLPGRVFTGHLFQVGASIDERTRTLSALAEVKNPRRRLKVGMFGSVRILGNENIDNLAIPTEAVQTIDGNPYVFIQEEADLFEVRRIETGSTHEGLVAVVKGLNPEDQVVSSLGFALKSEVLKARLGASCADH